MFLYSSYFCASTCWKIQWQRKKCKKKLKVVKEKRDEETGTCEKRLERRSMKNENQS
jgi:hypothetical protein